MKLSDLAAEMNDRFKGVDERFKEVDERFNQVDNQFVELRQQIAAEGEKTRRHFDIAIEQIKAERNLALHPSKRSCRITEKRLTKLEGQ